MKLDPVFTVKENKLYKISDNSCVDTASLKKIMVPWSTVELEPETYNEEYLAQLRDELKALDEKGEFAVLVPVVDKPLKTQDDCELFTNAYNHTARRVKDCVSVAGIELPSELIELGFEADSAAANFMEVLAVKHAQYAYFSKIESVPEQVVIY